MSLTSPEQPAQGQDQPVTPDPTPAAEAAPAAPTPSTAPTTAAPGSAPWAADLNAAFTDDATRGQVDQFLRSSVQPRMTQLEQQTAAQREAVALWDGFQNDPISTYAQVTKEMYGEDAAQAALTALEAYLQAQPGPAAQPPGAVDPRVEQAVSYIEQQQQREWYEGEIGRIQADPQYQDVDTELLHPFVVTAEGDFNQAVELYRRDAARWQQRYAPAAELPPPETPPNVMGSDTATVPTPPTQPQKQTLGEAIEEFVRDSRATPAPPVGTA